MLLDEWLKTAFTLECTSNCLFSSGVLMPEVLSGIILLFSYFYIKK